MEDKERTTQSTAADASQSSAGPTPVKQPGDELLSELTELADRFANVVRVAWNSEQRKRVETDVKAGLDTLSTSLEESFRQVSASPEAKDLQNKATEVGEKVSGSKFVAEIAGALTTGLRALSDQLEKLATDIQTKEAKPAGGGAGGFGGDEPAAPDVETKDIPIGKA
jgi:uncharacterized phage infection (PIP) family protein YhgE